ncbi:uncharacterized protein LOC144798086 [Lissotriton helveticus]
MSPLARTILITGCNRGIGLEIVRQLLAKPNAPEQIFATCRAPDSPQCQTLNELAAKNSNLKVIQLEATDPTSVNKAAKDLEAHLKGAGLNVLINNAGIMPPSTLETVDAEDLLHVYTTNVVGPLLVTKIHEALLPAPEGPGHDRLPGYYVLTRRFQRKGSLEPHWKEPAQVILIHEALLRAPEGPGHDRLPGYYVPKRRFHRKGSLEPRWKESAQVFLHLLKKAAKDNAHIGMSCQKAALINMSTRGSSITLCHELQDILPIVSYRCSKAALNMLTKCQSLGYKPDGILCTAIHPGWVQTDLGGPGAPLTPQESVKGILNVLYHLTEKDNGCLLDWEGKSIPW